MGLIGFGVCFIIGCTLIGFGALAAYVSNGLTGRIEWFCLIPMFAGIAVLYFASEYAPLTMVLT